MNAVPKPTLRQVAAGGYLLVWTAVLLLLGYDALLHPYSNVQRSGADWRLIALMAVYLVACFAWACWLAAAIVNGSKPAAWIIGTTIVQFVGYVVAASFLNGFPFY